MVRIDARLGDASNSFEYDEANYDDLVCILRELFDLPLDAPLVIKYRDDENDLITIGTSAELHDATLIFPQTLSLQLFTTGTGTGIGTAAPSQLSPVPRAVNNEPGELPMPLPSKTEEMLFNAENTGSPSHQQQQQSHKSRPARPSEFEVFANEFHYHRLIIQTAISDFFQRLRAREAATWGAASPSSPSPHQTAVGNTANPNAPNVMDTLQTSLRDLGQQFNNLPSPAEIGQYIANKLAELQAYTAPIVEAIRVRVIQALEQFYRAMTTRTITFGNNSGGGSSSSSNAGNDVAPDNVESTINAIVTDAATAAVVESASTGAVSNVATATNAATADVTVIPPVDVTMDAIHGSEAADPVSPVAPALDATVHTEQPSMEAAPAAVDSSRLQTFDVVGRSEIAFLTAAAEQTSSEAAKPASPTLTASKDVEPAPAMSESATTLAASPETSCVIAPAEPDLTAGDASAPNEPAEQPSADPSETPAPTELAQDPADDFVMVDSAEVTPQKDTTAETMSIEWEEDSVNVPLVDSLIMPTMQQDPVQANDSAVAAPPVSSDAKWASQIQQLRSMGYTVDTVALHNLLEVHQGNLEVVIDLLSQQAPSSSVSSSSS